MSDIVVQSLQRQLLADGLERGALLLCGRSRQRDPWDGTPEERFLVREVVEIGDSAYSARTADSMTLSTGPFYDLLKRAEANEDAIGFIHSHPKGGATFSPHDDISDRELFELAFRRLDSARPHFSVVMGQDGQLQARAFGPDLQAHQFDAIRIFGDRWHVTHAGPTVNVDDAIARQVMTFGRESTRDLTQLRIGIVGCGGTGSAVASLLARIGVSKLALFDADVVDETNLNRLHFSSRVDANLGRCKVDVVGEGIAAIGMPSAVRRYQFNVDDVRCREAIRACDVIFGCTDDQLGRAFLNRIAHFYLIPVIDLGVLIEPNADGSFTVFDGRVTVLQPGYPCLHCRKLLSAEAMQQQAMRRTGGELLEQYRRAGYVAGAIEPSPAVVTFTTEVACMAVNELFQRLTGFRGDTGSCAERVRRFDEVKDADRVPAGHAHQDCPLCGTGRFDGRGDMIPFLNQV